MPDCSLNFRQKLLALARPLALPLAVLAFAVGAPWAASLAASPLVRSSASSLAISEGGFYPTRTGVTIWNQHVIGRIIRDIKALPVMPRGIFACPNDVGVSYRLVFRYPDGSSRAVVADPSGCRMVTSRGERARWAKGTDHSALFSDLERLAG